MSLKEFFKWYWGLFIVIPFILFMCYVMVLDIQYDEAVMNSCDKIGMEYYEAQDSIFCIDSEDNANYIKMDCEKIGFLKYDCIPRIISIGDVRLKPTIG